jgi:nitrile hydratase accessory protein
MSDLAVDPRVADMRGRAALPRSNGELVFDAPWEGRAFAMALGLVDALGLEWDEFRARLIAEIDAQPDRPYYESWLAAVERLAHDHGVTPDIVSSVTNSR